MPMTEEQKQQIKTMHFDQGMTYVQIAEQLGLRRSDGRANHLPVLGIVMQEKVRRGIIPPPSSAPRKVKETKTITYDEAPPTVPGQANPLPGHSPQQGAPLFAGTPGLIERIEVTRFFARPQAAGTGYMGDIPGDSTMADIAEMWAGGNYVCKAFDINNVPIGQPKRVKINGMSKASDEENWGGAFPVGFEHTQRQDTTTANLVQGLMAMLAQGKQTQQLSFDEQLRLERERHQQALALQQQNAQQAMMLQQQANQQMMSIVVASTQGNKSGGLQETLAVMTAAKDLFGDAGGGDSDAVTEAIKNAPKMLDGLGNLIKMRGQQPQGAAPNGPQGMTLDQAGMTFYEELIKQGLTQEEAIEELQKVQRHLNGKVKAKQLALAAEAKAKQVQAAPKPPTPPAQTPPANGTAGAAA